MRPAFLALTLVSAATAQAQQRSQPRSHSHPEPAPNFSSQLPITRVALYKNGVGFFEHQGRVIGDQSVTIDFTSAQLNDVLQSLTAIDLNGGRISGAGYNSTTPLDQQLKTLPLNLTAESSDVDFYNAIRGARVQVTGPGGSISGRLLSIDLRPSLSARGAAEQSASPAPEPTRRFVTVVADSGTVKTIEITPATTVVLLDTALHTDVTRYLELLAANRSQGLRHLTLLDRGTGTRDLHVSYISEVPVWKSTYRILITDAKDAKQTATLQGWSVVDNTTGSDWTNVHLSLIAGAPQSFIQPLSTPYYARRPEIPLPAEAQLSPQTHESGDTPSPQVVGVAGMSGGSAGGVIGGVMGATGTSANQSVQVDAQSIASMPMAARSLKLGAGSGGNMGGGLMHIGGGNFEQAANQSYGGNTTTAAFDDFFEYTLTDPITIRKNESALVPILQAKLPVERVTLWSQQQPTALRALWLTNDSTLTLDRGSFAIVENGNFGGEGLLDPIHPGERRLLSYAADQAVRVSTDFANNTRRVQHLKISKGVLTETSLDVTEVEYLIRNAAPDARTIIVERPVRQGWTIDSDPKPSETTPTVNRFRVQAAPGQIVRLHIGERHTNYEYIRLVDQSEDQLMLLLRNAKASPATLAALQPVFDAHHAVLALDEQIRTNQAELAAIAADQNRIRENMKALTASAEEKTLIARYTAELNSQEDRLTALNTQLVTLRARRISADQDFQQKLEAVNLDESI